MNEEMNEVVQPNTTEVENVSVEENTSAQVETEQSQEPFMSIKYNKEDMVLDKEKAIEYAQKGMNYDKLKEKLDQYEADPLLSYVNEKGYDRKELVEMWRQEEEQRQKEELARKYEVDETLAEKIYQLEKDSNSWKEVQEREQQAKEKKSQEEKEYQAFIDVYEQETGKTFNADDIPKEIFDISKEKGKSLEDSFFIYQYQQLRNKTKEAQQEAENAERTTGSVTGNGNAESDFISKSAFESKKDDRNWVIKNLSKITKSRSKW